MKKIIMIGTIGAGKTTLSQALLGENIRYEKTQAIEIRGNCILDTPGEYLERRQMQGALMITAADADVVILLQDPTDMRCKYPPCYAGAFAKDVIGIVTKKDLASPKLLNEAGQKLRLAGAEKIFYVSSYTGEGIPEVMDYLTEDHMRQEKQTAGK